MHHYSLPIGSIFRPPWGAGAGGDPEGDEDDEIPPYNSTQSGMAVLLWLLHAK